MSHMGGTEADRLASDLDERLPEHSVTSVPWGDERGEWIVTVWTLDRNDALLDVFRAGSIMRPHYIVRKIGLGELMGETDDLDEVIEIIRDCA